MQKLKEILSILIVLIGLTLSSCSSTPENLKSIPDDANFVSVIDVLSLVKKGKLYEMSDMEFVKFFRTEVNNEDKKVSKILSELMEDPMATGISLTSDIVAYEFKNSYSEQFICLSIELSNEDKYADFVESLLGMSEVAFEIKEGKKHSYTLVENRMAIGWDEDKSVIMVASDLSSENLESDMATLFELKKGNQIISNEKFNSFYDQKKDISVWMSSNIIKDNYALKNMKDRLGFDMKDNFLSMHLNFGDDNVTLLTEMNPNEEIQEMMDENDVWSNQFNPELLQFFPEKNFASVSVSMNPMAYYSLFTKEDEFEKVLDGFKKNMGFEMKEVFESLDGSMALCLSGFENVSYTSEDWGYSFDESQAQLLDTQYEISEAGYLSVEDKELLNQGENIKVNNYSGDYSINIRNILDQGGTAETAIESNSMVNWYEGGWNFGKTEKENEDLLPQLGLLIDINEDKLINLLLEKVPESAITEKDGYYEFKIINRYPAYLAFNKDFCFVTNSKEGAVNFKNGGYAANSLAENEVASEMSDNFMYAHINLDYEKYPDNLRHKIASMQTERSSKVLNLWTDIVAGFEIKQSNRNSAEMVLKMKNTENNSLNAILTAIDDNYKQLMSL